MSVALETASVAVLLAHDSADPATAGAGLNAPEGRIGPRTGWKVRWAWMGLGSAAILAARGVTLTYPHPVRSWVLLVAVLLLTTSCSALESSAERDAVRRSDLQFDYRGRAESGMIDQTVSIANHSTTSAAVPTLSFVALDGDGQPLESVAVTTIFGSDRGRVVAPANYEAFDILRFQGPGSDRVEDVEVTVEDLRTLDDAGSEYPEVDYLDGAGQTVETTFAAESVRVRNPGAQRYTVRVVGIEWAMPPPGRPQQALGATPLGSPVEIGAQGAVEVAVPARLRGRFDSLKAYISID